MRARPQSHRRNAGARGGGGWGRVIAYTHTKKAIETEADEGQSGVNGADVCDVHRLTN